MRVGRAALVSVLAALLLPTGAAAVDSLYWTNSDSGEIRVGNLDGSGSPASLFSGESAPRGVALDPAANRIYWANSGSGAIRVGSLDGSGSASNLFVGEGSPQGVAVDPAANGIYWVDNDSGAVRVGNLDGSGPAANLFMGESAPTGVTIDPAAATIYWTNLTMGSELRVANLDGSGMPSSLFAANSLARGAAVDSIANRIYWPHSVPSGAIRTRGLDGPSEVFDLFIEQSAPAGVAIDPAAGGIYWANLGSDQVLTGNLDGSGTPTDLFEGEGGPTFPVLLRTPAASDRPELSGSGEVGEPLSCTEGAWSPDSPAALLFRAPRSFAYQWRRNGTVVAGATQPTYSPDQPGSHRCRVIASNQAGATAQSSAPVEVTGDPQPPDGDESPDGDPGADATVTLRIKGRKLSFNRRRVARAKLTCPAAEVSPPCAGRLALKSRQRLRFKGKRRRVTLARSKRFQIDAGASKRVRLRLAKPKRRLLRRSKRARRARAIVRVGDAAGNRSTVRKRLRVKVR